MFSLFINRWLPDQALRAISWTFIHSLWQGLIAAALAAIIIFYTKRSSARLRYNLLGTVLVAFFAVTLFTFIDQQSALPTGQYLEQVSIPADYTVVVSDQFAQHDSTPGIVTALTALLDKNANWLMAAWFIFFVFKCTRLLNGLYYTHRIRNYKVNEPSPHWKVKVADIAKYIGIGQTIQLMESELIKVPAALGFFKPLILVPVGMLSNLTPEQAETILLHELAHIRRRDYLVNLVQSFVETLFFFNPAVIWISSLIREEREACCDDIVMENTVARNSYLEALVSFHERQVPSYAMTLGTNKMHLLNRVKRMLTRENKKLSLMEKLVLMTGITLFTAFTFIPKTEPASRVSEITIAHKTKAAVIKTTVTPVEKSIARKEIKAVGIKDHRSPVVHTTFNQHTPDTIPQKEPVDKTEKMRSSGFSSIRTSQVRDSLRNEQTIEATETNGKKYGIKKLNGVITSFSIDDKEIPASEWDTHAATIRKLEATTTIRPTPFKVSRAYRPATPFKPVSPQNYKAEKFKTIEDLKSNDKYLRMEPRERIEVKKNSELKLAHENVKRDQIEKLNQEKRMTVQLMRHDSVRLESQNKYQLKKLDQTKRELVRNEKMLVLKKQTLNNQLILQNKIMLNSLQNRQYTEKKLDYLKEKDEQLEKVSDNEKKLQLTKPPVQQRAKQIELKLRPSSPTRADDSERPAKKRVEL